MYPNSPHKLLHRYVCFTVYKRAHTLSISRLTQLTRKNIHRNNNNHNNTNNNNSPVTCNHTHIKAVVTQSAITHTSVQHNNIHWFVTQCLFLWLGLWEWRGVEWTEMWVGGGGSGWRVEGGGGDKQYTTCHLSACVKAQLLKISVDR